MTLDAVERLILAALGKLSLSPSHTDENRLTSAMRGISESLLKSGSSLPDAASQERLLIIHLAAFSTAVYFFCSVRADLRSYVAHTRFERFLRHLYLQYVGRRSLLNVYTNLARNALSVSMNLQVGNSPSQVKTQALALCTWSVLQEDNLPAPIFICTCMHAHSYTECCCCCFIRNCLKTREPSWSDVTSTAKLTPSSEPIPAAA